MPLDDFATKQEVESLEKELAEIKKQNQEVISTLKSLEQSVKQGYIKVRGEDIPKMSELRSEIQQYAKFVDTKTKNIEKRLDQYGNIEQAVADELATQAKPLIRKYTHSEDTKTAQELKLNRRSHYIALIAVITIVMSTLGILSFAFLKLL